MLSVKKYSEKDQRESQVTLYLYKLVIDLLVKDDPQQKVDQELIALITTALNFGLKTPRSAIQEKLGLLNDDVSSV